MDMAMCAPGTFWVSYRDQNDEMCTVLVPGTDYECGEGGEITITDGDNFRTFAKGGWAVAMNNTTAVFAEGEWLSVEGITSTENEEH